jgi:bacillithiol system protein YtxJ
MIHWQSLTQIADLEAIREQSHSVPCVILKHSTRCNISSIAKMRLEKDWVFESDELIPYYLDLLAHRDISTQIAEDFTVYHESPQVLLIVDGECTYDASHLDITVAELREQLEATRTRTR